MRIKAIKIKNYLGIEERNFNPSNVNVFVGPKGTGKSSVLEAVEMAIAKNGRRTEVIRKGEEEAKLFLEMDNGLEIDRRLRSEGADYLKLRQNEVGISSTEKQLRQFVKGNIFRPLDFIDYSIKEQTSIILGMIPMDYVESDYQEWFDKNVLSGINMEKHTLQILKDVESNYYSTRQEINREIKTLEGHVKEIEKHLPENYDGEYWSNVNMADIYKKLNDAESINRNIEKGREIKEEYDNKIASIKQSTANKIDAIEIKYKGSENDINDVIYIANKRIEDAEQSVKDSDTQLQQKLSAMDNELQRKIQKLKEQHSLEVESVKESMRNHVEAQKELISENKAKVIVKQNELAGLDIPKLSEIDVAKADETASIEKENARLSKVAEYLESNEIIDIEPLKADVDNAETMRMHVANWTRAKSIREDQIAVKQRLSDECTTVIERARELPTVLLKKHQLPIEGISVDENGYIRVNGILLDGLSDGEKLDVAISIAMQRMGELKIMCLDGFEKLNEKEQKRIVDLCDTNDIQVFITITEDTKDGEIEYKTEI